MDIIWWEKTVEYQFVLTLMVNKKMFLAPLDGQHEQAGDAIFSANDRWLLIEFKKDQASVVSERTKFINYADAKQALSGRDGHHFLVFGFEGNETPPKLGIGCQTYFNATRPKNLDEILNSGTEFTSFKHYVKSYTKFKKSSKGGAGLSMTEFSLVAGVNSDGKISQCLALSEFQRQLDLQILHEKEIDLDRGYSR